VLKLAYILEYLHNNDVIYRDLKRDNILIDNKGFPNLFDFKTAKKLSFH
jgi:cGMP-dependent protein kinase